MFAKSQERKKKKKRERGEQNEVEARTDEEGVSQTESLARLRNSKQSTFFCPFCLVLHCRSFRTLSKVSLFLFPFFLWDFSRK